ncbi:MAG: class I SAM-dependent methyltransferase [Phycisphaerales bacterium]|jgi:ubiquinone/menaquinone biosynthesis C-methylase UbiE|nr:class I SAM-dependent methyltransferase [Phycisphaerales bacterium]
MTRPQPPHIPEHLQKLARVQDYGKSVDFGKTSDDYARFRPGPPASMYDRLERIAPFRGSDLADAACGPGWVALEAAARGARSVGFDLSPQQVEAAQKVAAQRLAPDAAARCSFIVARAESTTLPDASLDWYVASQAWHWFDHAAAAGEALRVLRPGGRIVVCSFDYLPGRSPAAKASEDLVLKYNPSWPMAGGTGCHLAPLSHLPAAGFVEIEQFSYEHPQPFSHEAWRGRMRTCNGVAASLSPDLVRAYDADLAQVLARDFPEGPEGTITIWHRVWVVMARKP